MTSWLIVSGGFHLRGGMDKANYMLAEYLAERGDEVHLVSHFVDDRLANHPMVTVHFVGRPLGSYFLGAPFLDWTARLVARRLLRSCPGLRIVANGSNCLNSDVNWVHFVHGAWNPPVVGGSILSRARMLLEHAYGCWREKLAFRGSRLIIANSKITREHILQSLGTEFASRREVKAIYLGSETSWSAVTPSERSSARMLLAIEADRKTALFVGGLGFDGRKGFDVLFGAWSALCLDPAWDVDLLVAGTGPAFEFWKAKVEAAHLTGRIRMLGFCSDVPTLLAASDVLVSTPRYEPYGLNIQEALARGLAVVASAAAGAAERLPDALKPLLLNDVESEAELTHCLRIWRATPELWKELYAAIAPSICSKTWREMAGEMVDAIESSIRIDRHSSFKTVSDRA